MIQKLSLESAQTIDDPAWQPLIQNPLDLKTRLGLLDSVIPQAHRSVIWKSLCQPSLKIQDTYAQLLASVPLGTVTDKDHEQHVARILKAYSVYDPEVGYNPSLSSLVAPLLHVQVSIN